LQSLSFFFFFFFNRHYKPLVGFRTAQLSLSILSRKVLLSAVASGTSAPPTWRRNRDLERSNFRHKRPPASEATQANPAAEGGTMDEKWPRIFAESGDALLQLAKKFTTFYGTRIFFAVFKMTQI
jgi:hypothetical protein